MKKTLSLALVVLMVVAAFSVFTIGSAADGDGWTLKDGTLTVTKDQNGAKQADYGWDSQRDSITKVVVGDEVTHIYPFSFTRCTNLTEVVVGKKCNTIDADAFSYNTKLESITFNCPIESYGQGIVFGCTGLKTVTLTNQTKEQFKAASDKLYNWENPSKEPAYFGTAEFKTVGTAPTVTKLDLKAMYGKIENYPQNDNGKTLLIVGGVDKAIITELKKGTYTLKKVVVKDETDQKTYTITTYFFDAWAEVNGEKNGTEADTGNGLLRLAVCDYGIVLDKDHAYTLSLEIWKGDEKLYEGTSPTGAFAESTQKNSDTFKKAFADYGSIVPENPPHTYEEAGGKVDPPAGGEHTAMIAVLAIVALFGSAVVVSKKVLSR